MSRSKKKRESLPIQNARDHALEMAGYGAQLQIDHQGAHRPRVIPDKRRETGRRACRTWRSSWS